MVRVVLKGVHVVRRRLADGSIGEYHYAWKGKGAPRLKGAPGSQAYLRSLQEAHTARKMAPAGTLGDIVTSFQASADLAALSSHTQRAYRRHLSQIKERFGNMPTAALADIGVRKDFFEWRDTMAGTPRTADYAMGTLKRLLDFGAQRGFIRESPIDKVPRLHRVDKSDDIWAPEDMAAFLAKASKELRWAVALAAHTGLRQGDLLTLPWGSYDGTSFTLRTSKRGKHVIIPATLACRALMASIERRQLVILTTQRGKRKWTPDGFRSSFGKACVAAGVERTFHDLRRTAATNLLIAGIESPQVAMIMGWSEAAVEDLKRKYVSRAAVVASVLAMLEKDS